MTRFTTFGLIGMALLLGFAAGVVFPTPPDFEVVVDECGAVSVRRLLNPVAALSVFSPSAPLR